MLTLTEYRRAGYLSAALTGAVNTAMILLADNELAASTVAVRIAAAARSPVYGCIAAGETAILCLIAGGHTSIQAAKKLNISHHTVAQHIAGTLRHAQVSSRGELIARACTTGLLAPDIGHLVRPEPGAAGRWRDAPRVPSYGGCGGRSG